MKKQYLSKAFSLMLIASLLSFNLKAQCVGNVNIPDANLKAALVAHNPVIDTNNDGEIQCQEAEAFNSLLILTSKNISDATGINAFINATNLHINSNNLTSLDVSAMTKMIDINCSSNQLTSLDLSNNPLVRTVLIAHNNFGSLDFSANPAITDLICNNTNLTELNLQNGNNSGINFADFRSNYIPCIKVDDETDATTHAKWNKDDNTSYNNSCPPCVINIPDANLKAALLAMTNVNTNNDGEIQCSEAIAFNSLLVLTGKNISDATGVNAFINATNLHINSNNLTSLDVSAMTKLIDINCSSNQLTSLDLSNNPLVRTVLIAHNNFGSLDFSANPAITDLICNNTNLAELNLKNGNNSGINFADFRWNYIPCIMVDDETDATTHAKWNKDDNTSYSNSCPPCIVNIPDANLKVELINNSDINTNNDNEIQCSEAVTYKGRIIVFNKDIEDATGLEAFVNCIEINIAENNLTSLDISKNTAITNLYCNQNPKMTSLNMANGNNTNILYSTLDKNPSLTCIQVDDENDSATHAIWVKDTQASYSNECCIINIPDVNLKAELIGDTLINTNKDTEIQCSEAIAYTGRIIVFNKDIEDATGLEAFVNCIEINIAENNLTSLDISKNIAITNLYCNQNPNMTSLNMANGNNTNILYSTLDKNPSLTCIQVDDENDSATHAIWVKDTQASYSNDCFALCTVTIADANFKAALVAHDPIIDTNNDGEIQCSEAEAFTGKINIYENTAVSDISGVEYFTNLTGLDVGATMITSIAMVNNPKLTTIYFDETLVQEADLSGLPKLDSILTGYNDNLTKLNVANGNNKNVGMDASGALNLTCITVDDENDAATHSLWTVDDGVSFSNNCTVGINELNSINFTISPNPSNGQFSVTLSSVDSSPKLTIANAFGQEVYTTKVTNVNQMIDVNHLPTGLYFVHITNNNQDVTTKKMIIQ